MPDWLIGPMFTGAFLLLLVACIAVALAIALSAAGPAQQAIARKLWPLAAAGFLVGVCALIASLSADPFRQARADVPLRVLSVPALLLVLGGGIIGIWLRSVWSAQRSRTES